jgi:hypothetical protein
VEVAAHHNFGLGLPYAPKGGSISRDLVLACRRDYRCPEGYRGEQWVTAGVDVGKVLQVRISYWVSNGKAVPLYIGEEAEFEDLAHLWDRYGVNFGLIDDRPEERAAREFAARSAGRGALLRWGGEEQRDPFTFDEDRRLVIARRTWACDHARAVEASAPDPPGQPRSYHHRRARRQEHGRCHRLDPLQPGEVPGEEHRPHAGVHGQPQEQAEQERPWPRAKGASPLGSYHYKRSGPLPRRP